MSTLSSSLPIVVVALCGVMPFAPSNMVNFDQGEPATVALRLLETAYPEIRSRGLVIRTEGDIHSKGPWLREFGIQIADKPDSMQDVKGLTGLRTAFFRGSFTFDDEGLKWFAAFGRLVRFKENEDFAKLLGQNPTWSDPEIASALKTHGARFGPETSRVMEFEARRIASTFAEVSRAGAMVVSSVDFTTPSLHDRKGGLGYSRWEVVYRPSSGLTNFAYVAHYEPFGGALVHLFRNEEPSPSTF